MASQTNQRLNAAQRGEAGKMLDAARKAVTADRGPQHGTVQESFDMIGEFWSTYLKHKNNHEGKPGHSVDAFAALQMMSLLKIARSVYGERENPDHYSDEAGYAALAGAVGGVGLHVNISMDDLAGEGSRTLKTVHTNINHAGEAKK